jgi:hypothetical protein
LNREISTPYRLAPWVMAACLTAAVAEPRTGQSANVTTAGGTVRVTAPGFTFIEGSVLAALRDGRSIGVDLELAILARSGGSPFANRQQRCLLSFDLWEERFAATRPGAPPRSLSHLTARRAEAWCLEGLAVPVAELTGLGRDAPFWIRLRALMQNPLADSPSDEQVSSTLGKLVDIFSRRRKVAPPERVLEAGPFRLTP